MANQAEDMWIIVNSTTGQTLKSVYALCHAYRECRSLNKNEVGSRRPPVFRVKLNPKHAVIAAIYTLADEYGSIDAELTTEQAKHLFDLLVMQSNYVPETEGH